MIVFFFSHDDVIFIQVFDHYRMIVRTTTLSNLKIISLKKIFCDLPESTISKLREINGDLLTAEEWK